VTLSGQPPASEEEVRSALAAVERADQENQGWYSALAASLCHLAEESDLHWRHYNTCLSMLCRLLRSDS
jgi:hypothetical protein